MSPNPETPGDEIIAVRVTLSWEKTGFADEYKPKAPARKISAAPYEVESRSMVTRMDELNAISVLPSPLKSARAGSELSRQTRSGWAERFRRHCPAKGSGTVVKQRQVGFSVPLKSPIAR
jgi:hypothetical protein